MIHFRGFLGNIQLLIVQFVFLLLIYSLLRLGFFFFNQALFPDTSISAFLLMMQGGVKFDVAALLYINALYILLVILPVPFKYSNAWQGLTQIVFLVFNSIGIALNLIDYAYYPFTLKRTTASVFKQFSNENNLLKLSIEFLISYWYLLLLFILIIYGMTLYIRKLRMEKPRINFTFYILQSVTFLFVIFLFIGGVRGGWAHSTRPITLNNAGDYVKSPEWISVVINTPFSIIRTLKANELKPVHYFSEDELNDIYPVVHLPDTNKQFKDLNVVILILESFGRESIGALNTHLDNGQYKGFTPFLDSLIHESYTFKYAYANGRKSIDALPSVITGVPSIGEPFVLSIYSSNKTTSLAHLLKGKGYETAFFHGAPNGSMGFSAYTQLAGIDRYYGKDEYNNNQDFDGIWGIWDEPFMQYMSAEMRKLKEPFFVGFFSLSSHHPFKVPDRYKDVFPKGSLPIHEPLGYSDHALEQFFKTASAMPWFDNTLFVICADHATVSHKEEYQNIPGSYAIPIIFYYPKGNLKGFDKVKPVQQIDILPTVMSYLNYDKPYFSLGFNALDTARNNISVTNNGEHYNAFIEHYYMIHDGSYPLSIYDLERDPLLKTNLIEKGFVREHEFDQRIKAFIQQYSDALINNTLTLSNKDEF